MRQIGFYFLFILSFVNRDILRMKKEKEENENWEEIFNDNYCISDKDGNILNLSDLEGLTLSEDKKQKLNTLNERLNGDEINVVEFCTAKENTIKFKVVDEDEIENITYFSCIARRENMKNNEKLCIGIVEDTILITKEGKLRNFENKNAEIKKNEELFLVKKPVKENLIFDKAFEVANNAKNPEKTEFEVFLLYSTIRNEIQNQENLKYEKTTHIFLLKCNKLYYYWDNIKKHIYFFQYYAGAKVFHDKPLSNNLIQALKNNKGCVVYEVQSINQQKPNPNVVHEVQDKNLPILDPNVIHKVQDKIILEPEKSCCQKCCDNCF